MENSRIYNSIIGFIVGDALGVPIEFLDKSKIKFPIDDYIDYGQHNMPKGAWSDDSSLMLCLVETLTENGLDYEMLSKKMTNWLFNGYMTPTGNTFGVGRSSLIAIGRLKHGVSYLESGETNEKSNGNGSLMRILPLAFYLRDNDDKFAEIEKCSAITHAHSISKIACSIFVEYLQQLMNTDNKYIAYENMQNKIRDYYKDFDLTPFKRILNEKIYELNSEELSGLGYVVSTLEVVLYSFINGTDYMNCVNLAMSFGHDTDTNAAITGSIAGYYFGKIPEKLQKNLIKSDEIRQIIENFIKKL